MISFWVSMSTFFQYLGFEMDSRYLIYLLVILLGAIIGLYRFRSMSRPYQLLTIYLLIIFISEVFSRYLSWRIANSAPSYHILVPIQIVFYTFFFKAFFPTSTKTVLLIGAIVFMLCTTNSFLFQHFYSMPSNAIMILAIWVITYVMLLFKEILFSTGNKSLTKLPLFWFSFGSLFFYSVTFFAFCVFDIFGSIPEWVHDTIWFCNIVMYGSYGISILLSSRKVDL